MSSGLEEWLAARIEAVPADFRSWLDPDAEDAAAGVDGTSSATPDGLAGRGLTALREAVSRPGRDRETAFRLLAADAYLTWASEALLEEDDPEAGLRDLVRRVADEAA